MKSSLCELREFLKEINYSNIMTLAFKGDISKIFFPSPNYMLAKKFLTKINLDKRKLLEFLFLGESIKNNILLEYLKLQTLDELVKESIMIYNDESYQLNNYIIIPYDNLYFFVGNCFFPTTKNIKQTPYFGIDSLFLAEQIKNYTNGYVLDLCCGSGIQGIIASKNANYVDMIDENSLKIAKINCILNNVENKVTVKRIDVFNNYIFDKQYDYIISNPPFIPINENCNYPLAGKAGEKGIDFIKNFIDIMPNFLNKNGKLIISGQCLGKNKKLILEEYLNKTNYNVEIYVRECYDIEIFLSELSRYTKLIGEKPDLSWEQNIKNNYDSYYTFMLYISNSSSLHIEKYNLYNKFDYNEKFYIKHIISEKFTELYRVYYNEHASLLLDNESMDFLKKVSGVTTLNEIFLKNNMNSITFKDKMSRVFDKLYEEKFIYKEENNE